MASRIIEFFGYAPADPSPDAKRARSELRCPFLARTCQKTLNDGAISGACTLQPMQARPVICCPIRLYANDYQILKDVAAMAFKQECHLYPGQQAKEAIPEAGKARIAVFGKNWGRELRLPSRRRAGGYYVDWILARLTDSGGLAEFVAIEVQSIDTTGNYRPEREAHLKGQQFTGTSTAGFNWENVSKRILPQIIYKGHVLRRERLCTDGLFFICPTPVYKKILERLGGTLYEYQQHSGALTFVWYDIGLPGNPGTIRQLSQGGRFTTTVDQVATAFTSPVNLPEANVYELAIRSQL
jgi:hypothetical protein